ncbi:MAG: hypothetical protein SOH81_03575 [Acetobacter sp.]|jgi:hypothetical protein
MIRLRSGSTPGQRPKRTLRQHVVRRLLMVLPLIALSLYVAKSKLPEKIVDHYTFNDMSWFNDSALIHHLRTVVTSNGMTDVPADCLLFIVNVVGDENVAGTANIDVMEKHSKSCPKPDGSLTKLFALQVHRAARQILTDQGSPGTFHPLP